MPGTRSGRFWNPVSGATYAKMRRKASPTARRTTIALTVSRVAVIRVGALRAPAGLTRCGAGQGASCTSAEVDRSIAEGRTDDGRPSPPREATLDRRATAAIGLVVVLALLVLYVNSNSQRWNLYNHFVWQASAWLEGQTAIRYPVLPNDGLGAHNEFFQDVMPIERPDGRRPAGR